MGEACQTETALTQDVNAHKRLSIFLQNNNGIYCETDAAIPWGPYTQQVGIWGYQEVLQAMYNTTMNDQVIIPAIRI